MAGLAIATVLGRRAQPAASGPTAASGATAAGGATATPVPQAAVAAVQAAAHGGPAAPAVAGGFVATMLPRHGQRPLGFHGRLLAEAGMQPEADGATLSVTSHVALYETAQGGLVAAIRHLPSDAAMPALTYAGEFAECDALKAWLAGHDPLADLPVQVLLPLGDAAPDAAMLHAAAHELVRIRARFQALLAALLTLPAPAPSSLPPAPAGSAFRQRLQPPPHSSQGTMTP